MSADKLSLEIAALEKQSGKAKNAVIKKVLLKKIDKLKVELEAITSAPVAKAKIQRAKTKISQMTPKEFADYIKKLSKDPKYSFLKGMSSDEIARDVKRTAKPVGWRFRGRENFKTPTKRDVKDNNNVYYENRRNRSDVSRSLRLETGGELEQYGTGGNVKAIERKVAEVNELIKYANNNKIEIIDQNSSWQTPMKYKPIKYSNGVLYVEYEELDLYKYKKGLGKEWKIVKDKVLKNRMEFDSPLNDIGRMFRKAVKQHKEYGYYAEGGGIADIHSKVLDYLAKHKFSISTFGKYNNNNIKVEDRNFGIEDQIAIEKIHPKILVSGSSNSNTWYIFFPKELAQGGGIDINELNMPVIRTQFEDEDYEFEDGGEITANERMQSLKNYPKLKF